MYISDKIEVRDTKKGKYLVVVNKIIENEAIFEFEKKFIKKSTRTSMQIDDSVHQESTNTNALENFLNHSCKPNGYIKFQDLTYRALRIIKKGERLTFNYNTTEWDMREKFQCECEFNNCYGQIAGFKYLTHEQQKELEPLLSPFLKKKLKKAKS